MSRTEMSVQQTEFFGRLKAGTWDFPPGIKNWASARTSG